MGIENRTGRYELDPDPDLLNLLEVWSRKIGLAIRTTTVGTVVAYNPATQEATITVDHLQVDRMVQQLAGGADPNEVNAVVTKAPLMLTGIPVIVTGSGDGLSFLSFPVTPGCSGTLAVIDRGLDTWKNRPTPIPVDPVKSAIHSLGDSVFLPGLTDRLHRIATPTSLTGAVLESPTIKIGAGATSNVVKAELLDALDAFANAVPVPNDGGAALQTAFKTLYQAIRPMLATTKTQVE